MKLTFNEQAKSETVDGGAQTTEPPIMGDINSQKMPEGFENWPKEEQLEYLNKKTEPVSLGEIRDSFRGRGEGAPTGEVFSESDFDIGSRVSWNIDGNVGEGIISTFKKEEGVDYAMVLKEDGTEFIPLDKLVKMEVKDESENNAHNSHAPNNKNVEKVMYTFPSAFEKGWSNEEKNKWFDLLKTAEQSRIGITISAEEQKPYFNKELGQIVFNQNINLEDANDFLQEVLKSRFLGNSALSPEINYTEEFQNFLNEGDSDTRKQNPNYSNKDVTEKESVPAELKPEEPKPTEEELETQTEDGSGEEQNPDAVENSEPASPENEVEFDIEEIKNSEEWKVLEDMRKMAVREEISTKQSAVLGLKSKWQDYENQIDVIENKIKEALKPKDGEILGDEQQRELDKKIKEITFKFLVEEEHKEKQKNEREIKLETIGGKTLEALKYATGSKAFKWYINQNKWVRLGAMSGLATIVGMGAGSVAAGGALTYGGYRLARGAISLGASTSVASTLQGIKSLSIDELNKKEKEELDNLESSDLARIEKEEKYNEIKNRYEKLRIQKGLIKTGATVAVGGLAGLGAGFAESYAGEVDLPSKGQSNLSELSKENPSAPKAEIEHAEKNIETPKSEVEQPKPDEVKPQVEKEALFDDPKIFEHNVSEGDNIWESIGGILEQNDKFKGLTEAQKTYILSTYTNEALQNADEIGIGAGGNIKVGDKLNFKSLFDDKKSFDELIEKAKNDIPPGSAREASIIENNKKIKTWVSDPENRGKALTNDKVSEILSTKPKSDIEKMFEPNSGEVPHNDVEGMVDPSQPERTSVQLENTDKVVAPESESGGEFPYTISDTERVLDEARNGRPVSIENEDVAETGIEEQTGATKAPTIEDYTDASQPERTNAVYRENIKPVSDPMFETKVEGAFTAGIDDIYGRSRLLGLGRIQGVDTKEWALIKGLSASKVMEFYTGNSEEVDFPSNIANELSTSDRHRNLWKQMDGLMKASDGLVKPYQNENIAVFMRRLVGYTLKNIKTT